MWKLDKSMEYFFLCMQLKNNIVFLMNFRDFVVNLWKSAARRNPNPDPDISCNTTHQQICLPGIGRLTIHLATPSDWH